MDTADSPDSAEFRRLCAIVDRCLTADPAQAITDLVEVVKIVLAKQGLDYDHEQLNRAITAVLWHADRKAQRQQHKALPVGQFRSTLEATWAAWLTRAGLAWTYEPKTFRRDALVYLPDFYLSDLGVWLEIKPRYPDYTETTKTALLAAATGQPVYILVGPPGQTDRQPAFMSLRCGNEGALTPCFAWLEGTAVPMPSRPLDYTLVGDVLRQAGILSPARVETTCACGHTRAEHYNPADYALTAGTVKASCRMHPCGCDDYQPRAGWQHIAQNSLDPI